MTLMRGLVGEKMKNIEEITTPEVMKDITTMKSGGNMTNIEEFTTTEVLEDTTTMKSMENMTNIEEITTTEVMEEIITMKSITQNTIMMDMAENEDLLDLVDMSLNTPLDVGNEDVNMTEELEDDLTLVNYTVEGNSVEKVNSNLFDEFNNLTKTNIMMEDIHPILGNSSLLHIVNVTKHRGILHGFSESVTVILVSEIGDKTFFIAAILAMRNNKLTVFLAAISALYLMTILSGLMGWVVTTFIPREITYYTCTAIMFAFALKMFWEAWTMDENEAAETQKEVEHELDQLDLETHKGQTVLPVTRPEAVKNGDRPPVMSNGKDNPGFEVENGSQNGGQGDYQQKKVVKVGNNTSWMDGMIDKSCKENSWFGKKCLQIFKLFVNTFSLTFIAEWGDRSQLATIVLAGINDVRGVIIGGCLGHTVCTGAAVLAGALIARYVSVRKITLLGALVFLGFAIASIFIDPNEDGIDGIPEIQGYSNTSRLVNHNISLTLVLEEEEEMFMSDY